jgi:mono/diheme cytochrome c family protein
MKLLAPAPLLFLAAVCSLQASAQPPLPPNDQRSRGAFVFTDNGCPQCHTIRHNGGKKGPDLSGVGRRLSEGQIRTQVIEGGKQMPPFGDVLKQPEIDDLVVYLHSCREKTKKK